MKFISKTCVVVLACLFCCQISQAGWEIIGRAGMQVDDGPRTAMIPFSNEMPSKAEIAIEKSAPEYATFGSPDSTVSSSPGLISYKLGGASLPRHLVYDHDVPEWVAELYKNDTINLIRMHNGHAHFAEARRHQRDADKYLEWSRLTTRAFDGATLTDAELQRQRKSFLESRDSYLRYKSEAESKFKLLKVTEPQPKDRGRNVSRVLGM